MQIAKIDKGVSKERETKKGKVEKKRENEDFTRHRVVYKFAHVDDST